MKPLGGDLPPAAECRYNCTNVAESCLTLGKGEPVAGLNTRVASSMDELRFLVTEDSPSRLSEGWSESKSENRLSRFELRRGNDGNYYTREEFASFYCYTMPTTWPQKWEQATERISPRLNRRDGLFLDDNGEIDEEEALCLIPPPPRHVRRTRWARVDNSENFFISDDEERPVLRRTVSTNVGAVRWTRLAEEEPPGMRSPRTISQQCATRVTGQYRENGAKDHPVDPITILENYCAKHKLPKPTYKNVNENTDRSQAHLPKWRSTLTVSQEDGITSAETYRKERCAEREVATRYLAIIEGKECTQNATSPSTFPLATIGEEEPHPSPNAVYCDSCDLWLNGPNTYKEHLSGKKHLKRVSRLSGSAAANYLSAVVLVDAAVGVDGVDITALKLEGYFTYMIVSVTNLLTREVSDLVNLYHHYQANVLSGVHYFVTLAVWSTIITGILLILVCILGYFMYDNTDTDNSAFKADAEIPKCLKCSEKRFEERDETGTRVFRTAADEKCTVVKVALVSCRCSKCSRFPRSYGSEPVRFYADEAASKLMHVFSTYRQGEQLEAEKNKAPKNYNGSLTGALSAMPAHSDNLTTFSQLVGGINSQQHSYVRSGFLPFATWCSATQCYMQATAWNPRTFDDQGVPVPETRRLFPQRDSYERLRNWCVRNMPFLFGPSESPPPPSPSAPPPDSDSDISEVTDSIFVRIRDACFPSLSEQARNQAVLRDHFTRQANRPQKDPLYDEESPPPPSEESSPSSAVHYDISDEKARELPPRREFNENSTDHLTQADRHHNLVNPVEMHGGAVPTVARLTLERGPVIASCCNLSAPGVVGPNDSIPTSGLQTNADPAIVATGLVTNIKGHHEVFPASRAPCLASEIENGAKIVFVFDEVAGQTCVACGPIVSQPTVWSAADPFARIQALEHRIEVDTDPRCYCFKKCKQDNAGRRECGEGADGKCCSCSGQLVGKAYDIRALYHKRATALCSANGHKYHLSGCIGCDPASADRPTAFQDQEAQHCLNKILLGQKVQDRELAALFPDSSYDGERKKFLDFIREKPTPQEVKKAVKWAQENLDTIGDGQYPPCPPGMCPNAQPLTFRGATTTGRRYTSLWSELSAKAFGFTRQREAFLLAFGQIEEIQDVFKHTKFSPDEIDQAIWNLKMLINDPSQMQSRTANTKAEVIVGKECKAEDLLKNRKKYNRLTSDTKKNKARLVYDNGIELMVLSYVVTKVFQVLLYSKEMGIFYQYSIKEQDREETIDRHLKKMMASKSVDGKVKWTHQSCMAELDQTGWERHQKEYRGRRVGLMSPIIGILRNICKNIAHFSPILGELATLYDNKISWDVDHGLVFDLKVPCVAKKGKTQIRVVLPELQVDSGWTLTSGCNASTEITGVLCCAFSNPKHVLCQAGDNDKKREKGEFHMVSLPDIPGLNKDNEYCQVWGGHTFNDTFQTVDLYWDSKFGPLVSEFLALVEGDDFAARMHRAFSDPRNAAIFENNQADLGASAKWKTVVQGRVEMIGIHAPVMNGRPVANAAGSPFWIPDLTKSLTKLGCKTGADNSPAAQVSRFAALAGIYYKKNLPLGTIFRNAALTIANDKDISKAYVTVKEYDELHRAGFALGKHGMSGILAWMNNECQGNSANVVEEVMLMNTSMREHPYPTKDPINSIDWGHLLNVAINMEGKTYRDSVEIYNMLPTVMRPKFH